MLSIDSFIQSNSKLSFLLFFPLMTLDCLASRHIHITPTFASLLHRISHRQTPTTNPLTLALALALPLAPLQRILAGLSSVLTAFPQLTLLDLSPTGIDGVGRADALEELGVCIEWQRACPTLRRVIFPSQTEWAHDPAGTNVWTQVGQ